MKVEEKIARAYHRDLSWRKVLVRLEPDAHNNMVVRRMFANAYGWPVVRHLVETHFSASYTAATDDAEEPNVARAPPMDEGVDRRGLEVTERPKQRSSSANAARREQNDEVPDLRSPDSTATGKSVARPRLSHYDSATWDERFFETDDEEDDPEEFIPPRSPGRLESHGEAKHEDGRKDQTLVSRRGKDKPHVDIVKPIVAPTLVQSPGGGTAATLGLRRSLEEQLDSPRKGGTADKSRDSTTEHAQSLDAGQKSSDE